MDCGTLTNPTNGRVSYTATTYGQTATYSCNTGYNLVGGSTRTCQATGAWSGNAPTCRRMLLYKSWVKGNIYVHDISLLSTAVNCGALTSPANGRVSYTAATYGHRASYSCNTGYNRVGDSTRICQATRRWSGSAPTCRRMLLATVFKCCQ